MDLDIKDAPNGEGAGLPPDLRFLKVLVTVLAGTMIAGLIAIIALIVIRFPSLTNPRPTLPGALALPDGVRAEAVTFGRGWIAVVTDTNEILILDPETGAVRQRIAIGADR